MNTETAFFLPDLLVVDVEEIDEQHAELFAHLAQLKDLCIESNCLPAAEADALLQSLSIHCDTEEKLAVAAGLDFTNHSIKHQKMLKGISHTLDEVRAGRTDVFSLIRFIEYWFERHIIDEDKALGVHLNESSLNEFLTDFSERSPALGLPQSG